MGKKKPESNAEPKKPFANHLSTFLKSETTHFTVGLVCALFGVYLLLPFTFFFFTGAADQSVLDNALPGELVQDVYRVKNQAGLRGAQLAEFLINGCFGIAAYIIPLFLAVAGLRMMRVYQFRLWKWFLCCAVLMVWLSIALGFAFDGTFSNSFIYPGGLHGYNVSRWLVLQVGVPGLVLLLLLVALLFLVYVYRGTIRIVRQVLHPTFRRGKENTSKETSATETPESGLQPVPIEFGIEERPASEEETDREEEGDPLPENSSGELGVSTGNVSKISSEPELIINTPATEDDQPYNGPPLVPYDPRLDLENYKFPTLDLLAQIDDNAPDIDMEEQNANKDRIIEVLRSFGIEITSIKASVGPTITLYEIIPAEGVRIAKIRNLENDIALSLAALGIRIIAPIPGKGTIGIEVPNAHPRIVPMKSILNSKKFQETTMELPVALGKTITNEVFMVDLAKAPHMLVAGATGQGKSVGLNVILTSLLYKKHPAELKFVIVDPKKVEFAIYAPIEKHYLAKLPDEEDAIVTDVTKVVQTLNSLCIEMDTRYNLLREAGCRNLKEYNRKFIDRRLNPEKGHRFLPYIVIIIDEFGDLIMTAGKEVELPICRIAQLARAVGIHAIIATQRPTTNIITGTIKANFPARVAFRVASMTDSRTILDRSGAQQLVGRGDLLYLQGNDPVRVQCAFVDTPEVEKIADYISRQQGYPSAFLLPEYAGEEGESEVVDVDMDRLDPLFEEAARLIIYHQQGSTSLIQRKFSIGYNRAGRIMDQLEKAGVVGPIQGSKPRDVLCMDDRDLEMKMKALQS